MKISELQRVIALSLTKENKFKEAKEIISKATDEMTPQDKAYCIAYQWVMPVKSEEEFKAILKSLEEDERTLSENEVEKLSKQYHLKYDSSKVAVGLALYRVAEFVCLSVLYNTDSCEEVEIKFNNFDNGDGVLCYVNNLDNETLSELGSVWFKWVGDGYIKA